MDIHLHFYDGSEGKWVTIHGTHVFIGPGGKIEKGPKSFVGKRPNELSDRGQPVTPKYHREVAEAHRQSRQESTEQERRNLHKRAALRHDAAAQALERGEKEEALMHVRAAADYERILGGGSSNQVAATEPPYSIHSRIGNKESVVHGGTIPKRGDLQKLHHTTHAKAALSILRGGSFKPVNEVMGSEAAKEIYEQDGSEFIYYSTSSGEEASHMAVSTGVIFEIDASGHEENFVLQQEMEGGLAMGHGPLPISAIKGISFNEDNPLNVEIMKTWERIKAKQNK